MNRSIRLALAATAVALAGTAAAQSYPSKQVTILTSIGAGSPTDLECRALGTFLQSRLGQTFVVEPRPGAGGAIAAAAVAKAAPDGHTLFCSGPAPTTFKVLIKDLAFDPLRDLAPISEFTESVSVYVTGAKSNLKTMDEFVAFAKANPGKLNYASAGRNSVVLGFEALKAALNINLTEVPYPGTPQALQGAVANDVQIIMAPISFVKGQIDAGLVRPLMVMGNAKSVFYPELPNFSDWKLDLPVPTWTGLFATGGTPRPVLDRLAAEIAQYVKSPEPQARQKSGTAYFYSSTPEQFQRKVQSEAARYTEIAAKLGWTPQ